VAVSQLSLSASQHMLLPVEDFVEMSRRTRRLSGLVGWKGHARRRCFIVSLRSVALALVIISQLGLAYVSKRLEYLRVDCRLQVASERAAAASSRLDQPTCLRFLLLRLPIFRIGNFSRSVLHVLTCLSTPQRV
jgi:hypothetical protein